MARPIPEPAPVINATLLSKRAVIAGVSTADGHSPAKGDQRGHRYSLTSVSIERRVSLATIAREWGRIGCIGFGGPPTHILLLRRLCVDDRGWLSATEFEDGIAATNL